MCQPDDYIGFHDEIFIPCHYVIEIKTNNVSIMPHENHLAVFLSQMGGGLLNDCHFLS